LTLEVIFSYFFDEKVAYNVKYWSHFDAVLHGNEYHLVLQLDVK